MRERNLTIPEIILIGGTRAALGAGLALLLSDRLNRDQRRAVRITDIWEVATFYSMINIEPVGKYHIQICKTLSCKILGANKITEHCTRRLGIKPGETTEDGQFSLSEVECLGSCGTAPMMQIGFDYYENLTTDKVDELIEKCKSGELSNGVR